MPRIPRHFAAAAVPRTVRRGIVWAALAALILTAALTPSYAADILLVIQNSSISSSESARRTQFQSWGHTVTTIVDSDSQANFNTAMAAVDVVYIPTTVDQWEIVNKCKATTKGLLCEKAYIDNELGFSTNQGWDASFTQTQILDNTHPVTTGLATGYVTIVSSSQPLTMMNSTVASGMTILSRNPSYGNGNMIGVMDAGAALAGGGTAAGRRVRLPWGGAGFNWSALNSNGRLIAQQAIAWAAAGTDPLALHWKLDESSGTAAVDSSQFGRNGTITGTATWVAAPRNNGFDCEAGDGAERISGGTWSVTGTGLTLAAWVRDEATASDGRVIMKSNGNDSSNQSWGLTVSGGDVDFRVTAGGTWDKLDASGFVPAGQWTHLVGTYDGTTMRLYVNGVLAASKTHSAGGSIAANSAHTVTVGDSPTGSRAFDGAIDDVRVYSKTLSDAEIAEVHGLIAHWRLNETSGTTADDATLANHDAALTGTQGWITAIDGNGHNFDYASGDDYFEGPNSNALNEVQEDDYTVMAYVRPNSLPPGSGSDNDACYAIVVKDGWHLGLVYNNAGQFQIDHFLSGNIWAGTGAWDDVYAPGRFYHVAGVISRTEGTAKIYVDGELRYSESFTAGADAREYGSNRWRIGIAAPGASSWKWAADAAIDDVRIYNRALADEELAAYANAGLVGWWKLDDGSGTTAADSSGKGHDGAVSGTANWSTDAAGYGVLEFNGSTNFVSVANTTSLQVTQQLTLAGWVKGDNWGSGSDVDILIRKGEGNPNNYQLAIADGRVQLSLDANDNNGFRGDTVLETGKWYHVAATWDGSTVKIYVNGQLDATPATRSAPIGTDTRPVYLGGRSGADLTDGAQRDLRIYSYALTPSEIAELHGLIGHWQFDEGSGSTIADSTLKSNHATFNTGTPVWIDGVRGGALEFDGSNDAATGADFKPPSEGTVCLWIKSAGPPTARQRFWGVGGDFEMWQDVDGLVSCDINTDGNQGGFISTEPLYDKGRWRHMAAVFDSDDDTYAIYLDGQLHKSGVSTASINQQAADLLSFGTRTGSTQRFTGALDDFRVYNRKLSHGEIAEIYGLVGWWRFEEGAGNTTADSSGKGNDGSGVGTIAWSTEAREGFGSLQLDGTNAVQVTGIPIETGASSITGWAKLTSPDAQGGEAVSLGDAFGVRFDTPSAGVHAFVYNGSDWDAAATSEFVEDAGWRHFAAVYDHDALELRFYIDGVLHTTEPVSGPLTLSGLGSNTVLGAHGNGGTTRDFGGLLDDVRIFNRAISKDEIRAQYYGGWISGPRIIQWVETR